MSSTLQLSPSFSQFQDIIDTALKDYANKTGKDIPTDQITARLLTCNSPDDVLEVLQEQAHAFNQYRNGDWKVQLIRRLKPTVDILLGLSTSGVFGQSIGLKFPPAQAIFAGVGLLLAAAKGVSTSYDALIDLFECFEHYLARLKGFTDIPATVSGILVKIMVELLAVLALATQQIKQGRFKKFAKKLLGENDIEAVLQRLDRLTMEESRMTAAQTMEVVYGLFNNLKVVMDDGKASIDNIREALVRMQQISEDLNKMKRNQLQEKIQKWLSPPDPSINHNTTCEAHHNGTTSWFLEGSIYHEWKTNGSLIWAHGKPGSGKSVLCSSIINDIERTCATGLASVVYHYFDFKDARKQDRRGFLCSLLNQLCTLSHHGYDTLSSLHKAYGNGLRQPSEDDLIKCLKNVLPGQGRVYIIVDALDECPNRLGIPSPREKVMGLVNELVDLRHPDIRICVTSRPEVDIQTALEPLASYSLSLHDERGQRNDIINYVKSVVDSDARMRKWRAEDRQLVIDSLSQKADGMFRWVVCQLDTLRRSFPASIRRALDSLPRTLDETYERILLGIDEEKQEYAIRLFQCLTYARRPLHTKELAEVIALQFDAGGIPRLNVDLRPGDAEEAVLSACSTLVTIIQPDDLTFYMNDVRVVQFSHYSVKEFLTSERLSNSERRDLSQYYVSPEPAHTILAQSCLSTLLLSPDDHNSERGDLSQYHVSPEPAYTILAQNCLSTLLLSPDDHIGDIVHNFPLAKYAAQNWFYHARFDGVASRIQDGMERLFDPEGPHFAAWASIHDLDAHFQRFLPFGNEVETVASPLYYAVLCGIGSVVEHLVIRRRQHPNNGRGRWGTPLHAAVVLGHIMTAQFLLRHSADANIRNNYGSTPLHEAIENKNLDVAQLLLSHGADVNSRNQRGDAPLHQALRSQRFDIVKLLLKAGADVNARDRDNSTPLHEALESGNLGIAQLLLSHHAYINALDNWGDTPLHKALRFRKFNVVNLLIRAGANVNSRNKDSSTPLHEASESGNLDVAHLLLCHGADVNVFNHRGESPLHNAVQSRKLAVADLLLKGGANANARNDHNPSPLHKALEGGNPDIVQLLLTYGADGNALDHRGEAPLHKALRSRKFDVVELLVKGDVNVNTRDKYDSTPLHEALESGNLAVAQLLLSHGADVNAQNHRRDPPLHQALRSRLFDIVGPLLTAGADVNARDRDNSTPLHEALKNRNDDIVQLLLGHGADVNARNQRRDTPLHQALRSQKFHVVEPLLRAGADVNTRDSDNSTPLHEASESGNIEIAQLLLSYGANANALNNRRDSPLHKALRFRRLDVVDLLLKGGADVNSRNENCSTPLHEASESGNLDIAQLLLSYGADINTLDSWGDTPLHKSLRFRRFDVVDLLLRGGADVNSRNENSSTPLHEASESGNLDIARLLLSYGADINALDHWGDSPLHNAVQAQKFDVVALLLKGGADVNARDSHNSTPLHKALESQNLNILQLLLTHGADGNALDYLGFSPLHKALRSRKFDVAELLVKGGADVNVRDGCNSTPLHLVSFEGSLDVARLLIEHGADVNAQDDENQNPFSIALARGHRKLARFLSYDSVPRNDV